MAFQSQQPEEMTKPKRVVRRRGHLFNCFLQPDGTWGKEATAKRFNDGHAATSFAFKFNFTDFDVFPISIPRKKGKRKT